MTLLITNLLSPLPLQVWFIEFVVQHFGCCKVPALSLALFFGVWMLEYRFDLWGKRRRGRTPDALFPGPILRGRGCQVKTEKNESQYGVKLNRSRSTPKLNNPFCDFRPLHSLYSPWPPNSKP